MAKRNDGVSKKEAVLTVLYRFGDKGLYNLHVLDEIQKADESTGRKKMSLGTFYPTVKRLEEDGLIEGFWDDKEIAPGVRRRFLRITGAGLKALLNDREYRLALMGVVQDVDGAVPPLAFVEVISLVGDRL